MEKVKKQIFDPQNIPLAIAVSLAALVITILSRSQRQVHVLVLLGAGILVFLLVMAFFAPDKKQKEKMQKMEALSKAEDTIQGFMALLSAIEHQGFREQLNDFCTNVSKVVEMLKKDKEAEPIVCLRFSLALQQSLRIFKRYTTQKALSFSRKTAIVDRLENGDVMDKITTLMERSLRDFSESQVALLEAELEVLEEE